ncbi:MAG: heparinase II/III family protein, partial [Gammaproteobacteria bacterium]
SHDGYDYLKKGGVRHQRRFIYRGNTVRVFDSLYGDGTHLIESYLHLHPDLHAVANGKIITIKRVNEVVALMTLLTDIDVQIIKGKYFPEFGREMENTVIHMSCVCRVPVNISYMIEKHTQTEV